MSKAQEIGRTVVELLDSGTKWADMVSAVNTATGKVFSLSTLRGYATTYRKLSEQADAAETIKADEPDAGAESNQGGALPSEPEAQAENKDADADTAIDSAQDAQAESNIVSAQEAQDETNQGGADTPEYSEPAAQAESNMSGEQADREESNQGGLTVDEWVSQADYNQWADIQADQADQAESNRPDVLYAAQDEQDEHIRRIAAQVFEELFPLRMNGRTETDGGADADLDEPPEVETLRGLGPGRRCQREYQKFTITLDQELWKRLVVFRDRRKVKTARACEILLWRALGRPKLSYEGD